MRWGPQVKIFEVGVFLARIVLLAQTHLGVQKLTSGELGKPRFDPAQLLLTQQTSMVWKPRREVLEFVLNVAGEVRHLPAMLGERVESANSQPQSHNARTAMAPV